MLILLPSTLTLIYNTIITSYQEQVSFFFTFVFFFGGVLSSSETPREKIVFN